MTMDCHGAATMIATARRHTLQLEGEGGTRLPDPTTVPAYLCQLLREQTSDPAIERRCRRHLPLVWAGVAEYVGHPLDCRMAWDGPGARDPVPRSCDHYVRPNVLQRWYMAWCRRTRPEAPGKQRWLRYTLNRLAGEAGFHIQHAAPRRGPAGAAYVGLRLTQKQEALVDATLPVTATPRMRYCLRRFVAGFPLWDAAGLRATTRDEVQWWRRERRPVVVSPGAHHDGWFEATSAVGTHRIPLRCHCGARFRWWRGAAWRPTTPPPPGDAPARCCTPSSFHGYPQGS